MKLGSLFDGAGGFPLAAVMCGIEPVWASEIEPFPIAVTHRRFPNMKHLGDVSKINGAEIEPVDIITFGSPCQDLSVAGKRAGLDGERSGLFLQAIRIINEMRGATNGRYPTIAVWENVPGAFSSAKGEDFRAVLEAFCRVKDDNAVIPRPSQGKWADAGEIVGDGYSVAWRVLDAQFWGVPQRRRRIFLAADFTGGGAGDILFVRDGLQRDFAESTKSWQGAAPNAERGVGKAGTFCLNDQGGMAVVAVQGSMIGRADRNGPRGSGINEDVSFTLDATDRHAVAHPVYSTSKSSYHTLAEENLVNTLVATDYKDPPIITEDPYYIVRRLTPTECARLQGMPDWWVEGIENPNPTEDEMTFWREVWETYRLAINPKAKPKTDKQIRKWLADPHSDSAEYKMWGNGMALPCVLYVMEGIKTLLDNTGNA